MKVVKILNPSWIFHIPFSYLSVIIPFIHFRNKFKGTMTTKAAAVTRTVRPLLSMDSVDARVRVLSLYKAWYRHIPFMVKDFHFPRDVHQCRDVLRYTYFVLSSLSLLSTFKSSIVHLLTCSDKLTKEYVSGPSSGKMLVSETSASSIWWWSR